jgi:hypothetical protein
MIAAAGADDLKHVGVAAVKTAVHDPDRLTPHVRRPAVAGLPGRRERVPPSWFRSAFSLHFSSA